MVQVKIFLVFLMGDSLDRVVIIDDYSLPFLDELFGIIIVIFDDNKPNLVDDFEN